MAVYRKLYTLLLLCSWLMGSLLFIKNIDIKIIMWWSIIIHIVLCTRFLTVTTVITLHF